MDNLKIVSTISFILSIVLMIMGIGVVVYFVDDLFIRGLTIFLLIMSSVFVSRTMRIVFQEKNSNS